MTNKSKSLKPGMVVTIYEDPLTRERKEGRAKLVKQVLPDEGDGLSSWIVEFKDEPGYEYQRTVNNG